MNWNEVMAICAILTLGGTIHIFVVISIVRKELEKTYQRINGTYVRSELFNQYKQSVERHFDFLRDEHLLSVGSATSVMRGGRRKLDRNTG